MTFVVIIRECVVEALATSLISEAELARFLEAFEFSEEPFKDVRCFQMDSPFALGDLVIHRGSIDIGLQVQTC